MFLKITISIHLKYDWFGFVDVNARVGEELGICLMNDQLILNYEYVEKSTAII